MARKFEEAKATEAKYPHIVMIKPKSRAIQYGKDGAKQEGTVEGEETCIPLPKQFVDLGYEQMGDHQYKQKMADASYFVDYLERLKARGFEFKGFGNIDQQSNRFARSLVKVLGEPKKSKAKAVESSGGGASGQ